MKAYTTYQIDRMIVKSILKRLGLKIKFNPNQVTTANIGSAVIKAIPTRQRLSYYHVSGKLL